MKEPEMHNSSRTPISDPKLRRNQSDRHDQPFLLPQQRILANSFEDNHCEGRLKSELEQLLAHFQDSFITPCTAWAAAGAVPDSDCNTIFYPFGGPDILFPLALFPKARELVLVGREPCWLQSNFSMAKVTDVIRHYLRTSFFITEDLKHDLSTPSLSSILPLLLVQLGWTGHTLLSVDEINTDSGFCISFHGPDGVREIRYFRQDLRNEFFSDESLLFRHIVASEKCITFLKSASYLLHEPHFSILRQLIKRQTHLLAQDPSGLPYSLLCNWGWDMELHGCFTSDIPPFSHKYDQNSLRTAYQEKGNGTPLPFGFGYLKYPTSAAIIIARSHHDRV